MGLIGLHYSKLSILCADTITELGSRVEELFSIFFKFLPIYA